MSSPPAKPTPKTWVIVGASRGIGREFVEQLLSRGDRVVATVRGDTSSFSSEQRDGFYVVNCDIAVEDSIDDFVRDLSALPVLKVDYVVLNAGVLKYPNRATDVSFKDFAFHLNTNTIGPIICAQKLLQCTISIGTIVFMSSDSGSLQSFRDMEDGFAAYASSKAALNMAARHMDAELKRQKRKTSILMLHPGEVETDMSNIQVGWEVVGVMTAEESVRQCIQTIESKRYDDSGTFWTWENKPMPW